MEQHASPRPCNYKQRVYFFLSAEEENSHLHRLRCLFSEASGGAPETPISSTPLGLSTSKLPQLSDISSSSAGDTGGLGFSCAGTGEGAQVEVRERWFLTEASVVLDLQLHQHVGQRGTHRDLHGHVGVFAQAAVLLQGKLQIHKRPVWLGANIVRAAGFNADFFFLLLLRRRRFLIPGQFQGEHLSQEDRSSCSSMSEIKESKATLRPTGLEWLHQSSKGPVGSGFRTLLPLNKPAQDSSSRCIQHILYL